MTWGKWSKTYDVNIVCVVSPSWVSIVCTYGPRVQLSHSLGFRPRFFDFSVSVPWIGNMKHQGKRIRSEDHPGSGKRPSVSHRANPALSPINLSFFPKDLPPRSPPRKPIPNSAFQTTHFKFQRNLNRPLISAQITILMMEEENQVAPLSCIVPNTSHSSKRSSEEDSQGIKREIEPGLQDNLPPVIPPLVDSDPTEVERDAVTADFDKVMDVKEPLSHGDACQDAKETHGEATEND